MIQVNPDLCKDHEACILVCPQGAIGYRDGHTYIDPILCRECGACITACPEGAIGEVRKALPASTQLIRIPDNYMPLPVTAQPSPALVAGKGPLDRRIGRIITEQRRWLPALGSALIWAGREILPQVIRVWRDSTVRSPRTPVSAPASVKLAKLQRSGGTGGRANGGGRRGGGRTRSRQRWGKV